MERRGEKEEREREMLIGATYTDVFLCLACVFSDKLYILHRLKEFGAEMNATKCTISRRWNVLRRRIGVDVDRIRDAWDNIEMAIGLFI